MPCATRMRSGSPHQAAAHRYPRCHEVEMTDSPRRDGHRSEPTDPYGNRYPGYIDPAYAAKHPMAPNYAGPDRDRRPPAAATHRMAMTRRRPATGRRTRVSSRRSRRRKGRKTPRWLWMRRGSNGRGGVGSGDRAGHRQHVRTAGPSSRRTTTSPQSDADQDTSAHHRRPVRARRSRSSQLPLPTAPDTTGVDRAGRNRDRSSTRSTATGGRSTSPTSTPAVCCRPSST